MGAPIFKFRLQPLLRRWEVEEERRRLELSSAEELIRQIQARARVVEDRQARAADDRRYLLTGGGRATDVVEAGRWIEALGLQRQALRLEEREAVVQRDLRAQELLEAARERKRLEMVRDRAKSRWEEELRRKQGAELDEMGILRHSRKDSPSPGRGPGS